MGASTPQFVDDFPNIAALRPTASPPQYPVLGRFCADGLQRRHTARGNIDDAPYVHHQRPGDLDEGHAHAEGRDGVPQDRWKHSQATGTKREHSTSRAAPPGLHRRRTAAARSRASCLARWITPTSSFRTVSSCVSAAERLGVPRRRYVADRPEADVRLRPAVGLLLAVAREVRQPCPSSIPSGANPGAAGARVGSRLLETATARRATAHGIRRRTGTVGSPRGWAPSTDSTISTVLRSGWGLFYQKAFYPGWGGGVDQAGFN